MSLSSNLTVVPVGHYERRLDLTSGTAYRHPEMVEDPGASP